MQCFGWLPNPSSLRPDEMLCPDAPVSSKARGSPKDQLFLEAVAVLLATAGWGKTMTGLWGRGAMTHGFQKSLTSQAVNA